MVISGHTGVVIQLMSVLVMLNMVVVIFVMVNVAIKKNGVK